MIREWFARLRRQTNPAPATASAPPAAPIQTGSEAERRIQIALRRSKLETARLRSDGSELAERVRRNAQAGRNALEGKS